VLPGRAPSFYLIWVCVLYVAALFVGQWLKQFWVYVGFN